MLQSSALVRRYGLCLKEKDPGYKYCIYWVRCSVMKLEMHPLLQLIKGNQLRQFGHLIRMPPGLLPS